MKYLSTRGDATPQAASARSCSKAGAGRRAVPARRLPASTRATLARWRGLRVRRRWRSRSCRCTSTTSRRRPARSGRRTYTAEVFGTEASCRCAAGAGLLLEALSNGPTLAFKDMAMQLLGNLFEYELGRRGEQLNILGATSGDTGSAAEYAMRGKQGVRVFMLSPNGRMSPFQQAQMFSLQDANIHNIAVEGVFDDCQDIVKAVSNDLAFKRAHRIGTVNSINWARLLAQVVYYFAGYFQATKSNDRAGQLCRAVGQLRQRLRRPCGAHDGPADQAPGGGHQRERRARRVLPHRQLPGARQGRRDARDLQPVDGHLQGLQLRALRLRPAGARRGAHPPLFGRRDREAGKAFRLSADEFARIQTSFGFQSGKSTHADRLATIRHTSRCRHHDRHPHGRRREGGARAG
jgi:threonine synthase